MDTNQNLNINTFVEGMDSDTMYSNVKNTKYTLGINTRISSNKYNIGGDVASPEEKQGLLNPITVKEMLFSSTDNADLLKGIQSKDANINVVFDYIYKTVQCGEHCIILYKTHVNKTGGRPNIDILEDLYFLNVASVKLVDNEYKYTFLFRISDHKQYNVYKNVKNISVVLNLEQTDVLKLYIADGVHKIMELNILDKDYINKLQRNYFHTNEKKFKYIESFDIQQNGFFPRNKVIIDGIISGQLKTGQVQYAYVLYKKHGGRSMLSPLTNKIQVISGDDQSKQGRAEDTVTNIGFKLKININSSFYEPGTGEIDTIGSAIFNSKDRYDSILLYRISYIKPNQNAEIDLIYDSLIHTTDISSTEQNVIIINDSGLNSLQKLTIEEFSALYGQQFVPKVIEKNQEYLLAGNIKDKTVLDIKDLDFKTYSISMPQNNKSYFKYITPNNDILTKSDIELTTESTIDEVVDSIESSIYGKDIFPAYSDINSYRTGESKSLSAECIYNPFNYNGQFDENFQYTLGGFGKNIQWRFITVGALKSSTKSSDSFNPSYSSYLELKSGDTISTKQFTESTIKNKTVPEIYKQHCLYYSNDEMYHDIFSSSILRSLKRGETYRYGIVLYSADGNRSNVYHIGDIKVPRMREFPIYDQIWIYSIGLEFKVTLDPQIIKKYNIVGYEIVRCKKHDNYTRNLEQCVIAKPVRQDVAPLYESNSSNNDDRQKYSPYYPTGFLTSQPCLFYWFTDWSNDNQPDWKKYVKFYPNGKFAHSEKNQKIFQLFSTSFICQNDEQVKRLQNNAKYLELLSYIYPGTLQEVNKIINNSTIKKTFNKKVENKHDDYTGFNWSAIVDNSEEYLKINRSAISCDINGKTKQYVFDYDTQMYKIYLYPQGDNTTDIGYTYLNTDNTKFDIKSIKDSKNLEWNQCFSEVKKEGEVVKDAIKQYSNFVQTVSTESYVNFVCCGKYYGDPGTNSSALFNWGSNAAADKEWEKYTEYTSVSSKAYIPPAIGPLSAGGQCFVCYLNNIQTSSNVYTQLYQRLLDTTVSLNEITGTLEQCTKDITLGAYLCNITHEAQQFSGKLLTQMQYDTYYGFGNYFNITSNTGRFDQDNFCVFDGSTYIAQHRFITAHKFYDFNDFSSNLQSMQVSNNVIMESDINPHFMYGPAMNNSNTNVQIKPASIEGVVSQELPAYNYNNIYSDNESSNNIFNAQQLDKLETNFPQRIFYSQVKTNGENVDNWQIFKPADFVDTNSQYGEITDIYTMNDRTYVFQKSAVGKMSINERSIVKDNNDNDIQLGQGTLLKRIDYLDTKYGMRKDDMCITDSENRLFWFDYYNNCICTLNDNSVTNYSDSLSVTNILNMYDDIHLPKILYDKTNNELYFGNIRKDSDLYSIIFNTKYNIATSLYKDQDTLFTDGFYLLDNYINKITNIDGYKTYCYSKNNLDIENTYVNPMIVQFVVNNNVNTTKVFDNQQIIYANRRGRNSLEKPDFFNEKNISFMTDLYDTEHYYDSVHTFLTDREGVISYPIPRVGFEGNTSADIYNEGYGQRLRGKWMVETYSDYNTSKESTINNFITKTRQSYN